MPVSKNKRQKKNSRKHIIQPPKLLDKLPCTESAVQKIAQGNNAAVLRMYFGTADKHDADYLYTHLVVSWFLAEHMIEAAAIRQELLKGISLLVLFYKQNKLNNAELDALQDILLFSMELWRKSTVEEVVRIARASKDGTLQMDFSPYQLDSPIHLGQNK